MKGAKRIAAEECGGEFLFHVITPLTPYSISFDSVVLQQEKQDPFPLRSHFTSDFKKKKKLSSSPSESLF